MGPDWKGAHPLLPVSPAEPAGWGVGEARWDLPLNVEPWDSPESLPHGCCPGQMLVNTPSFCRAGAAGMEGLNMMGREAELPQCHPSSVLLWRSQTFVKYGVPGKSKVFGSDTDICFFLALRP